MDHNNPSVIIYLSWHGNYNLSEKGEYFMKGSYPLPLRTFTIVQVLRVRARVMEYNIYIIYSSI